MQKFAHSLDDRDQADWEPLSHHLSRVGDRAAGFAAPFGASTLALAMGLLHDIGKASDAYQLYIRRGRVPGAPKGPDHSSAGAQQSRTIYGDGLGRLMAFGIAGHHSGLMDGDGLGASDLNGRLTKELAPHDDWRDHVIGLPDAAQLHASLAAPRPNAIDPTFSVAFLPRMLFSALVDADFLETEGFYAQARGEAPPPRGGTLTPGHRDTVRSFLARHRRADTPVNQLRSAILDHANGKAALPPGLFTLTVPTGGGKTLTSLSFAMEHALTHRLARIIYVIPFTEAWIETSPASRADSACWSRLPHGGVDRNTGEPIRLWDGQGRLPHGGVDRNNSAPLLSWCDKSRLPHGGVDRNCHLDRQHRECRWSPPTRRRGSKQHRRMVWRGIDHVASHTEAWIETRLKRATSPSKRVASHTEAWIETASRHPTSMSIMVASHTEAWIET